MDYENTTNPDIQNGIRGLKFEESNNLNIHNKTSLPDYNLYVIEHNIQI